MRNASVLYLNRFIHVPYWLMVNIWTNIWFNPSASIPKVTTPPKPTQRETQSQFPWLSDKQVAWVRQNAKTPEEQMQLYKQVLPVAQKNKQMNERVPLTNELVYNKSSNDKTPSIWIKVTELANAVRAKANWPINKTDDDIIGWLIKVLPWGDKMLADYLNWTSDEIFYISWLKEQPQQLGDSSVVSDSLTKLWIWAWWLLWTTVLWKWIREVGNFAYNEAIRAISNQEAIIKEWWLLAEAKAWLWLQPKTIAETAIETKWTYWTPVSISAAAKKWMNEVREWVIAPVFNAIDGGWFKLWVSELESRVFETIDSMKKIKDVQGYANELKEAVSEYFTEKYDKWIESWNLKQLQGEKVALRDSIQKKITSWKLSENVWALVNKAVSDTYSDIIHTRLNQFWEIWKQASRAFTDRWNLKSLEDASRLYKRSTLWWWWVWVIQFLQDHIWVPAATAWGKLLSKIGWIMAKPWEALVWMLKWLTSSAKNTLKAWIKWGLTPAELIAPDMLVNAYMSQWMTFEEAEKEAMNQRAQILRLPWEAITALLEWALWLEPAKESKEYRNKLKKKD